MEFSREEYWSGLPFPSPGDLPDLGIEPESPTLQADSLSMEAPWSGVPFPSPGDLPPGESKQAKTQADKMGLKEGLFSNETKFNFLLCTHQKQELRQHVSGLASMRQLREFRVLFFLFLFAFLGMTGPVGVSLPISAPMWGPRPSRERRVSRGVHIQGWHWILTLIY